MVSPEQLRIRSLRAYEWGRLLTASRVALLLVPVAALCLVESRGREMCACLAVVLLGSAIWLRWRDRRGMQNVTTGLLAGSVPLLAALALGASDVRYGQAGAESFGIAVSALFGAGAGLFIAVREARWRGRFWSFATASTIAALAASLGCVRLGFLGVAGLMFGIAIGTCAGAAIVRRSRL